MPGVRAEDLRVTWIGDRLTLKADVRPDPAPDGATPLKRGRLAPALT